MPLCSSAAFRSSAPGALRKNCDCHVRSLIFNLFRTKEMALTFIEIAQFILALRSFTLNCESAQCLAASEGRTENSMASSFEERLRMSQKMMSDLNAHGGGELEQVEEGHPLSDESFSSEVVTLTVAEDQPQPLSMKPSGGKRHGSSLEQSYSEQIRPLLDVVDRLRNLDVTSEGIDLPSIVVIGDQSSGKSSVLESLAWVRLPKGEGICTRVPLVLRLQSSGCSEPVAGADEEKPKITIKYLDRDPESISEDAIPERIAAATDAIAGNGKGIAHDHITLHIVRRAAPDLTLIDLPGITRVPLPDQPPDIYEQIKDLVLRYISPTETIILNVLSAHIDFPTAESIRWSKLVDASGDRTLAVVTKCDERPDGLCEKITTNAVEIGQGYICVRNCLRGETLAEARNKEAALFTRHPLLRPIDKSMVGVPALASKLMQIQATKICSAIPTLLGKVNGALAERQRELQALPPPACRPEEAHVVFMNLLHAMADGLRRLLLDGDTLAFPENDPGVHCQARLRDMCEKFLDRLEKANAVEPERFLVRESELLEQARGDGLPNFLPRAVFRSILRGLVEAVEPAAEELVEAAWEYMERVVQRVVALHCGAYPALYASVQRTVMDIAEKAKKLCIERVREMLLVEKLVDFTLTPTYMEVHAQMLQAKPGFLDAVYQNCHYTSSMSIKGLGEVDFTVARSLLRPRAEAAYDLAISVAAYWQVVTLRLGDGVPLLLRFRAREMVTSEFERTLLEKFYNAKPQSMGRLMAESSGVSSKRNRLKQSIRLLQASKAALSGIFIDQPSSSMI